MMRLSHYRKVLSLLQTRNRQFSVKTEIESKIIATEIIKPSFPTPKSIQKHQLSYLDQLMPTMLIPLVYFYPSNSKIPTSQKSNHLKRSLSETLSRFYPLAGRIVDNLYVDCKDDGALFAEAEANCDLSRVISNPDPERIRKLLTSKSDESQGFCLAVQATYFRCGGLALSILISHKIADASSMITFANTWSAVARDGGHGVPSPKFDAASYFPSKNIPRYELVGLMQEEVATRIHTFSAARIAALQERYATTKRRPSRVAALSAYLWSRFIFAVGKQADPTKLYSLKTVVNLRSSVEPPMSEYHFGNIISISTATLAAGDSSTEVVQKVREAKKGMHTMAAKGMDEINEILGQAETGEGGVEGLVITSLCGFSLYGADFGWGKPVWVVAPGLSPKNVAVFTDTKSGGGVEVLLHLTKQVMEKFEAALELND